jgi:hypothetical protein
VFFTLERERRTPYEPVYVSVCLSRLLYELGKSYRPESLLEHTIETLGTKALLKNIVATVGTGIVV